MKRYINYSILAVLTAFVFMSFQNASGQDFIVSKRSQIWETFMRNGLIGSGIARSTDFPTPRWQYPGREVKFTYERRDCANGGGLWIGAKNVTDISGMHNSEYVSEIGIKRIDPNLILEIDALHKIENFSLSDPEIRKLYPAEENIICKFATDIGVTMTRKVFTWSYPKYDDFIVIDYVFKNTGDMNGDGSAEVVQTLDDFYIMFVYSIAPNMYGHNEVEGPQAGGAGWPFAAKQLNTYSIEHNMLWTQDLKDSDFGNLNPITKEFITPEVTALKMVYIPLNKDGSTVMRNFYTTYPANVLTTSEGFDAMYKLMSEDRQPKEFQQGGSIQHMSWGPFILEHNEELHVVIAQVCGSISKEMAMTGDPSLLDYSVDSLMVNIENLNFLYDHNYNVPDPPPAPEMYSHVVEPGKVTISWSNAPESYQDPDYTGDEALDFDGYRVYRSRVSMVGPWEKIFECSKSAGNLVHEYVDTEVVPGYGYFYTVTSFDKGHDDWSGWLTEERQSLVSTTIPPQESGKTNRDTEPTFVVRVPSNSLDVKVVPNPFRGRAQWGTEEAENQIMFTNLPAKATIKIYTLTGVLVNTLEHTDGSGTEYWADQRSASNQYVKSGVYYYTVESDVGSMAGKFIIIR